MVAVANVRVNTQAPFPTMVVGAGPITVTKSLGVWQIGMNGSLVNSVNPGPVATDYVFVWDSVQNAVVKISLPNLVAQAIAARAQRSVTSSPISIVGSDQIINVNISSGTVSCALPPASSRAGAPLTFKDVGGNFAAHPLTLTASGGDLIDGAGTFVANVNRQAVTIVPYNDGVNTGWALE